MLLGLLAIAHLALGQDPQPEHTVESLMAEGVKRTYVLHVPPAYDRKKAYPLVILLHGAGANGAALESHSGMGDKADVEGFILVAPDAIGKPTAWNHRFVPNSKPPDDTLFIDKLLDDLTKRLNVDPKRIYIAGHSNGAMMALRLGAVMANRVAAVASVEGTVGFRIDGRTFTQPAPVAPVSVLLIHGRADNVVPYDGHKPGNIQSFSAPESAQWWAECLKCLATPRKETFANGEVERLTYVSGKGGTVVSQDSVPAAWRENGEAACRN